FAAAQEAVRGRDDFLAAVSHDLKNPLLAIKGQVHLLQRLPMLRAKEADRASPDSAFGGDKAGPAAPEKEADRSSVDSALGGVERVSRGLAAIDAATTRMTRL